MSHEESVLVNELKELLMCSKCKKERKIIKFYSDLAKIKLACKNQDCRKKDKEETLDLDELIEDKFLEKPSEYENKDEEDQNILEENDINNKDLISNGDKTHKKALKDKIRMLSNIIRANQLVLETQEKHPNNYYHILSLENLGKSYEEEAKREVKYIDDLDTNLKKIRKDINIKAQNDTLKTLLKDYEIYIEEDHIKQLNLRLVLRGISKKNKDIKKLGDVGFELITKLIFRNLTELIVPSNNIKDIECLNNMLLPHLELLDMSDNQIKDIQPIANIKSKHLNTIILHDNQIERLDPFYKTEHIFFKLKILSVQNNDNLKDKETVFKGIKEKHKGVKIFFEKMDIKKFNDKHNTNINEEDDRYNLGRIKKKREVLLDDLFNLVKFGNNIRYLLLDNNNIKDASLLSRMPLYSLRILDLSVNKINNISFLKKLSKTSKRLEELFLDVNEISDISVLICVEPEEKNVKKDVEVNISTNSEQNKKKDDNNKNFCIFRCLQILTLKKNKFDANKNAEIKEITKVFKERNIETDIGPDTTEDKEKPNGEINKNKPDESNK